MTQEEFDIVIIRVEVAMATGITVGYGDSEVCIKSSMDDSILTDGGRFISYSDVHHLDKRSFESLFTRRLPL